MTKTLEQQLDEMARENRALKAQLSQVAIKEIEPDPLVRAGGQAANEAWQRLGLSEAEAEVVAPVIEAGTREQAARLGLTLEEARIAFPTVFRKG